MVSRLQHLQKEAIIGLFGITTGREVFIFFLSCVFITLVAYSSWMAIVCDKLIDLGDDNEESCLNPTPLDLTQHRPCEVQGCSTNPNAGPGAPGVQPCCRNIKNYGCYTFISVYFRYFIFLNGMGRL